MEKIIQGYQCNLTPSNSHVTDSYKLQNKKIDSFVTQLILARLDLDYPVDREHKQYVSEIKAHNRLYKLHIARSHTADVDMEEPIVWWKQLFFDIIGF